MAAEISEITESNQESPRVMLAEILATVRKLDAEFERLRPLLDKYTQNPAARWRRTLKGD